MKEKLLNTQTEGSLQKLDRSELKQLENQIKSSEVTYKFLLLGGFGWSRGTDSLIQILDGDFKDHYFIADLGGGLHNPKEGPLNLAEVEKYKAQHKKMNAHLYRD